MRKEIFAANEYYHIFNQGIDKRLIFQNYHDSKRFLQSMLEFNSTELTGSLFENSFQVDKNNKNRLVDVVCYCLNPNHFHFLLRARQDDGISKFMHRLSTGYTNYFNEKYKRRGSLFQGPFKVKHINDNDYLLHVSAYVNLNNRVHSLGSLAPKSIYSSHGFYVNSKVKDPIISGDEIILSQFKNPKEYKTFAEDSLKLMLERKKEEKELKESLLED